MKFEYFIVTGVTGRVGQHFLYELLRKYLSGKIKSKIIVLLRAESQAVAQSRLVNLLSHAEVPEDLSSDPLSKKLEPIEVVAWKLGEPIMLPQSLQLKKSYCLVHLASSLNLFSNI